MAKQVKRSGTQRGRRYELSDEGYARLEPLLPKQQRGGRWNDHRTTLNGMFWVLNSGENGGRRSASGRSVRACPARALSCPRLLPHRRAERE